MLYAKKIRVVGIILIIVIIILITKVLIIFFSIIDKLKIIDIKIC